MIQSLIGYYFPKQIFSLCVNNPKNFQTWSTNGWLAVLGSLDYAGGTPVHIASGFAGLAMALVLGKRAGFEGSKEWKPHNLSNVFLGTAILWFGWFGFNGGSAIAGTARAAMAASGKGKLMAVFYSNI